MAFKEVISWEEEVEEERIWAGECLFCKFSFL